MTRFLQWVTTRFMSLFGFDARKNSAATRVARISVLASGKILLDGKAATVAEVRRALEKMKSRRRSVWYYRESGKEPPAQAIEVFKLIVEMKLPISLSTKPDFSDYVDENGQSQPRR